MKRDQIELVPEFKELMDFLRKHELDDGVWRVFGGSPIYYSALSLIIQDGGSNMTAVVDEIKKFIHKHFQAAIIENVVKSSPNTEAIIQKFRELKCGQMSVLELKAAGLQLDFPNKVFRVASLEEGVFIIPINPAIGYIINRNILDDSGLNMLSKTIFAKDVVNEAESKK